ncbi:hypothetical protein GWK47_014343 [Chionoecetes opilio]|uniref:Uncharacterized protein n=1 Tax=Chionoecetes opilio TaxID=41210 RepID=A0A8J5CKJ7_CHIOP|nr:hypothetical protein GWK47_014343 [Chionoecetes opilio]
MHLHTLHDLHRCVIGLCGIKKIPVLPIPVYGSNTGTTSHRYQLRYRENYHKLANMGSKWSLLVLHARISRVCRSHNVGCDHYLPRNTRLKDSATVGDKGLKTLEQCSQARSDGLHEIWQCMNRSLKVHITCRKDYTRPSTMEKEKRKLEKETEVNPTRLRCRIPTSYIKKLFVLC